MEKERIEFIGTRLFGGSIDITDPCYDRDVWCRINDQYIVPGFYDCEVVISNIDDRVMSVAMYQSGLRPSDSDYTKYLGEIGVDAGLAGFFEHKPDYNDSEWHDFCNTVRGLDTAMEVDCGFVSRSGYGDGGYDVFAVMNEHGCATAVKIIFIENVDTSSNVYCDYDDGIDDDCCDYDEYDEEFDDFDA